MHTLRISVHCDELGAEQEFDVSPMPALQQFNLTVWGGGLHQQLAPSVPGPANTLTACGVLGRFLPACVNVRRIGFFWGTCVPVLDLGNPPPSWPRSLKMLSFRFVHIPASAFTRAALYPFL